MEKSKFSQRLGSTIHMVIRGHFHKVATVASSHAAMDAIGGDSGARGRQSSRGSQHVARPSWKARPLRKR
jgi:hypothetical protein